VSKIKICGLFRKEDIEFANEAKPDFIGFVFAEKSKRFVSSKQAETLRKNLSKEITPVGVFVNAEIDFINELYKSGTIQIAQLHGTETEEYAEKLKSKTSIKIIKAQLFSPTAHPICFADTPLGEGNFALFNSQLYNYVLFDSSSPGSGQPFDWEHLQNMDLSKNIFLAGGINLENIKAALELSPFAIDVSSGAETDGVKDRGKILQLVKAVR
jgi:phosphoribosylanthranilate isomerase